MVSSCVKEETYQVQNLEVYFVIKNKRAHYIETNVKTRYTITDDIKWVKTFQDFVELEKRRVDNPCVWIYEKVGKKLFSVVKLEDCSCTETEFFYDQTKGKPSAQRFFVEIP